MKKTIAILLTVLFLIIFSVVIFAMGPIWACSNHNPAHTATSTNQIQQLTNDHQCSGWYRIK